MYPRITSIKRTTSWGICLPLGQKTNKTPLTRESQFFPVNSLSYVEGNAQGAPSVCQDNSDNLEAQRQSTNFYWSLFTHQAPFPSGSLPLLTYSLTKAMILEPIAQVTTMEAFAFLNNNGSSFVSLFPFHYPKKHCHPALWVSPPEVGSVQCSCFLSTSHCIDH